MPQTETPSIAGFREALGCSCFGPLPLRLAAAPAAPPAAAAASEAPTASCAEPESASHDTVSQHQPKTALARSRKEKKSPARAIPIGVASANRQTPLTAAVSPRVVRITTLSHFSHRASIAQGPTAPQPGTLESRASTNPSSCRQPVRCLGFAPRLPPTGEFACRGTRRNVDGPDLLPRYSVHTRTSITGPCHLGCATGFPN